MDRGYLLIVVVIAISACTPIRTTIKPPYPLTSGYVDDEGLKQAAEARCRTMQGASAPLPPHPFTTDGCSVWPDSSWRACCIEHDFSYWCGGSPAQRSEADRELRACVTERSNSLNAWLMFWGVRAGGIRLTPWPWRWGYGYDWPFRFDKSSSAPLVEEERRSR